MNLQESIRNDLNKFNTLLTETLASQRVTLNTAEDILNAIKEYDNADEILNADFNHIKEQMSFRFRRVHDALQEVSRDYEDEATRDLYFAYPSNPCSWTKTMKALKKVPHQEVVDVYTQHFNTWKEICDNMKVLKTKIVKAGAKRAEKKEKQRAEFEKKKAGDFGAMVKLLEKNRKEYIAVATERAEKFKDNALKHLERVNMNLDLLIPASKSRKETEQNRQVWIMLTDPNWVTKAPGEPDIRKRNPQKEEKWINEQIKNAELNYDAFIAKMVQKIGEPVVDADLKGNIWDNSVLTVKTESGEEQVWITNMIINFSKFGKMFNQFPTRRKK